MKSNYAKWTTVIIVSAALPWFYLFGEYFMSGVADAGLQTSSTPEITRDDRSVSQPSKAIVFAGKDGAFHVEALINGGAIRMIVDTGATVVALREEDAETLGVKLRASDFKRELQSANGKFRGADIVLREVVVGGIIERNVDAVVIPRGLSTSSLLGRTFTSRLKLEAAGDRMLLSK